MGYLDFTKLLLIISIKDISKVDFQVVHIRIDSSLGKIGYFKVNNVFMNLLIWDFLVPIKVCEFSFYILSLIINKSQNRSKDFLVFTLRKSQFCSFFSFERLYQFIPNIIKVLIFNSSRFLFINFFENFFKLFIGKVDSNIFK